MFSLKLPLHNLYSIISARYQNWLFKIRECDSIHQLAFIHHHQSFNEKSETPIFNQLKVFEWVTTGKLRGLYPSSYVIPILKFEDFSFPITTPWASEGIMKLFHCYWKYWSYLWYLLSISYVININFNKNHKLDEFSQFLFLRKIIF